MAWRYLRQLKDTLKRKGLGVEFLAKKSIIVLFMKTKSGKMILIPFDFYSRPEKRLFDTVNSGKRFVWFSEFLNISIGWWNNSQMHDLTMSYCESYYRTILASCHMNAFYLVQAGRVLTTHESCDSIKSRNWWRQNEGNTNEDWEENVP